MSRHWGRPESTCGWGTCCTPPVLRGRQMTLIRLSVRKNREKDLRAIYKLLTNQWPPKSPLKCMQQPNLAWSIPLLIYSRYHRAPWAVGCHLGLTGFQIIKSKTQCLHWWLEFQHPGVTGFTGARCSSSIGLKARLSPPATWLLPPGLFIRHQVYSCHVSRSSTLVVRLLTLPLIAHTPLVHPYSHSLSLLPWSTYTPVAATTTTMHPVQCCRPDCPHAARRPAYCRHW